MKTLYEKEKKLNEVLEKLNLLNPQTPDLRETIANLDYQKNQLEIEKKDLDTCLNLFFQFLIDFFDNQD